MGGTGNLPVPVGNLPTGMTSGLPRPDDVTAIIVRCGHSARQVAGRNRPVACATLARTPRRAFIAVTRLLLVAAALLAATLNTLAGPVRAYVRSNGTCVVPHYRSDSGSLGGSARSTYVYRNPYAASPSVSVGGYSRSHGTYVEPHVRTPANDTVTDNLSYRGYGTVRVPRY